MGGQNDSMCTYLHQIYNYLTYPTNIEFRSIRSRC